MPGIRSSIDAAIVPATLNHIPWVANHVRPEDRVELRDLYGHDPFSALTLSYFVSDWAMTGLVRGEPVCMFGVAPADGQPGVGRPWMIGTSLLDRYQVVFLRNCRPQVARMQENYPLLENWVDRGNKRALRWLRWLGFGMMPSDYGDRCIRFTKER